MKTIAPATPKVVFAICGLVLLGGLFASSCTTTPNADACATACRVASRCGLLPSALGGAVDQRRIDNERDCITRCTASDGERPQVTRLLAQLGGTELDSAEEPLCNPEGTALCKTLIAELESDLDTSELVVTTDLTIRMVSTASHVASVSLPSWCCFDYDYELDHEAKYEELSSEDIDELAAVYEMFGPTGKCLSALRRNAINGFTLANGMPPMTAPDPEAAAESCVEIQMLWDERAPGQEVDLETDPCYFARKSSRLRRLGIPTSLDVCEPSELDVLDMALGPLADEWGFRKGVLLDSDLLHPGLPDVDPPFLDIDPSFLDIDSVRQVLQTQIREEITRPRGLLQSACAQLFEELDVAGCDELELDGPIGQVDCMGGPLCSPADCLARSRACDSSLCDAELPPPGRDCGQLSITDVQLGYRDAQGLEVLGEPVHGCEALEEVVTTFEGVKVGPIIPIAVVSGTLPSSSVPADLPLSYAGEFSWIVEGHVRWVTAGASELELPSPLLDQLELKYDDPIETLGWVPRRLPTSKACDSLPEQCEGYFNDNCDNGIDDDGDGLVDDASAWCDELLHELVERCVVTEPGRAPPEACVGGSPA
jgi:hypothetical protein